MTLVAFAPNWLGDVVMALPAIADLVRHTSQGGGRVVVAARRGLASLFEIVPGVDAVVPLGAGGLASAARSMRADAAAVRGVGAVRAVLFPNSLRSALVARLAGVPERLGYARDLRGPLLTARVPPARGGHQVDAYQRLAIAAGADNGSREPSLDPPPDSIDAARRLLADRGWDGVRPLVGLAPGAAFGGAKRWPSDRFAGTVASLVRDRGACCVLVGSGAEAPAARAIAREAGKMGGQDAPGTIIDLAGQTTLVMAAAVLAACRVFVSNDSGAMHLAAAVGTPLVAVFGPTDERATAPVARPGRRAAVVAGTAWCRPCGLRECPIDHRCLTSVSASRVIQTVGDLW